LSDCWRAEERGKSIAIYSLAPFLGPALGPVGKNRAILFCENVVLIGVLAGGFVTEQITWRWVFWSTSAIDAAVQVLAFLFLNETYAPRILAIKAKKLRHETGDKLWHTQWETPDRSFGKVLRTNLARPFIMLFTQPAIQVLALYRAYLYGIMYLV
jgi:MFS family permease